MVEHEPLPEPDIGGGIHCRICRHAVVLIEPWPPQWVHVGDLVEDEED